MTDRTDSETCWALSTASISTWNSSTLSAKPPAFDRSTTKSIICPYTTNATFATKKWNKEKILSLSLSAPCFIFLLLEQLHYPFSDNVLFWLSIGSFIVDCDTCSSIGLLGKKLNSSINFFSQMQIFKSCFNLTTDPSAVQFLSTGILETVQSSRNQVAKLISTLI